MILGVVLAGGRSSRFGSDKAEALWRGRRLIDHAFDSLVAICDAVGLCGRTEPGYPAISDRPIPGLGPLGGLCGALHHGRAAGFERVLLVPCDTPIVAPDLLRRLARAEGDVYLARCPVIGCWRTAQADRLERHLTNDADRSMRHWAETSGATRLTDPAPPNVNTPADLATLDLRPA